ncbi:hypothetical protein [Spartinivicinus ruber]|uniref:hypothetical protein n=1 Tax=Spartinivicinus ruber TaxID=2683272 RepID=UPI0013D7E2F2|nr:hypothetical protein [Spartinivicinus ruber]
MKKILVTALAVVSTSSAHAEWTNVICAKPDASHWDWLKDNDGNQVTISGQEGIATLSNNYEFSYFGVSEASYRSAYIQCRNKFTTEHVPQPADSSLSIWKVFQVNKPNGEQYIAPGHFDTSRPFCSAEIWGDCIRAGG